jgi:enterochelin esterase-like enzyme
MKCFNLILLGAALHGLTGALPLWASDPDFSADGDYTLGPTYSNAPEASARANLPVGAIHNFKMYSSNSAFYPGIKPLARHSDSYGNRIPATPGEITNAPYTRNVSVYVPQQYKPGAPAPFLVVLDGPSYGPRIATVLDNLIADHRLPVMIGVFVGNGGGDAQGSERGLEYDTVSGKCAEFIEAEVLPEVEKECSVTLTKDPEGRATFGGSSGGTAAFSMAWFHPELYHRVLTYSGTYVNQQSPFNSETPHGAWDYHDHIISQSPVKPLRVWLQVGEEDLHSNDPEQSYHNWPLANQRMAAVLKSKGYHYQFFFCKGARHVDGRVVGQTLPEALTWLWQGYPVN